MNKVIKITMVSIIFLLILLTILVSTNVLNQSDTINNNEQNLENIKIIGEYSIDDKDWQPYNSDINFSTIKCTNIKIRGYFNKNMSDDELLIYIRNLSVTLVKNDINIYTFGNKSENDSFNLSGITWGRIAAKDISSDDYIELSMSSYFQCGSKAQYLVENMLNGNYAMLIKKMLAESGIILIVAFLTILTSALTLILAIIIKIFKLPEVFKVVAFSFYAIINALWILLTVNYLYVPLIIPIPKMAALIDIFSVYILPLTVILIIMAYISKAYKQILIIIFSVHCLINSIVLFLQIFNIIQIDQMQVIFIPISTVMCLLCLGIAILDIKRNNNTRATLMIFSLLPCFIGIFFDIGVFYISSAYPTYIPSCIGCIITLVLQFMQIVFMIRKSVKAIIATKEMENELLQSQMLIMLSQIQPHFIYNVLTAISALCDINVEKAKEAIIQFSLYLRKNFDSLSVKGLIPFNSELEHIKTYLALEKMRYDDELSIEYDIQNVDFFIPTLTVQPIVENAVRYGLMKRENGGTIRLSTMKDADNNIIVISDNGVGFNPETFTKDERTHIGIQNVKNRITTQCKGKVIIHSEIGVGTIVTITIPIDLQ